MIKVKSPEYTKARQEKQRKEEEAYRERMERKGEKNQERKEKIKSAMALISKYPDFEKDIKGFIGYQTGSLSDFEETLGDAIDSIDRDKERLLSLGGLLESKRAEYFVHQNFPKMAVKSKEELKTIFDEEFSQRPKAVDFMPPSVLAEEMIAFLEEYDSRMKEMTSDIAPIKKKLDAYDLREFVHTVDLRVSENPLALDLLDSYHKALAIADDSGVEIFEKHKKVLDSLISYDGKKNAPRQSFESMKKYKEKYTDQARDFLANTDEAEHLEFYFKKYVYKINNSESVYEPKGLGPMIVNVNDQLNHVFQVALEEYEEQQRQEMLTKKEEERKRVIQQASQQIKELAAQRKNAKGPNTEGEQGERFVLRIKPEEPQVKFSETQPAKPTLANKLVEGGSKEARKSFFASLREGASRLFSRENGNENKGDKFGIKEFISQWEDNFDSSLEGTDQGAKAVVESLRQMDLDSFLDSSSYSGMINEVYKREIRKGIEKVLRDVKKEGISAAMDNHFPGYQLLDTYLAEVVQPLHRKGVSRKTLEAAVNVYIAKEVARRKKVKL